MPELDSTMDRTTSRVEILKALDSSRKEEDSSIQSFSDDESGFRSKNKKQIKPHKKDSEKV